VVRDHEFDLILVSVARVEKLAITGELVKIIRNTMPNTAPIVVGGPVIYYDEDVKSITGADHVSNDIQATLAFLTDRIKSPGSTASEI